MRDTGPATTTMAVLLRELLLDRNAKETTPFVSIHEAYDTLLHQVDALRNKCDATEREASALRQRLEDAASSSSAEGGGGGGGTAANRNSNKSSSAATAAALKNEARLRDKLEKLQEGMNSKLKSESEGQAEMLRMAKEISEMKDLNTAQERTIANLRSENERSERAIEHLTNEMNDAKSRTELAEKQYEGLKKTIRSLQEVNDALQKENRTMEERLVSGKGETVEEINTLNDMVNALKMEVDMLRSLKLQEDKRRGWFGGGGGKSNSLGKDDDSKKGSKDNNARKFGSVGVFIPSSPKQVVAHAHSAEGTCVRYDASGSDLLATASSDSTVKVWDANSGTVRATLRGTAGHSVVGCDIYGGLVVGGGSDKTCRVWNLRTERMVHHLVGHAHKITCVRFFNGQKNVISGSADRSLKVWDISRTTYRQTVTLRHSSTSNSVDVGSDAVTAVTGHLDGGLRFWDLRTADRTADIAGIHEGAITSVQFDPTNSTQVLTNSMDSSLKIVDIRTGTAVHTLRHQGFSTVHAWSRSTFSPDGNYALAGSNSAGDIFVWSTADGSLKSQLSGHKVGVCGVDWGRGGSSGQQVASVDRSGTLVLWA